MRRLILGLLLTCVVLITTAAERGTVSQRTGDVLEKEVSAESDSRQQQQAIDPLIEKQQKRDMQRLEQIRREEQGRMELLRKELKKRHVVAEWKELTFSSSWGPCPYVSKPEACRNSWKISRDSHIVHMAKAGHRSTKKLTKSDQDQLSSILARVDFPPVKCPPPATDTFDDIRIVYKDDAETNFPVTGCAYSKNGRNPAAALKVLFSRY